MTTDSATPSPVRRYLALALVGVIGGALSGAFGVGGGIVMVPLLIWLAGLDQRHAAATSLVAILPTAIAGAASYFAQGEVNVLAGLLIAAGGIVGSIIVTRLLKKLPIGWLRWLFIALLLAVAVQTILEPPARGVDLELTTWTIVGLVGLGVAMGVAAGLFGIGGGVVAVPVLIALFGMGDLVAKGTSLLAMIPTATTGSIANLRNRLVRLSDGLIVGIFATGASFGGVALAFWMEPRVAAILFALLVLFASVQLSIRAIKAHRAARNDKPDTDA